MQRIILTFIFFLVFIFSTFSKCFAYIEAIYPTKGVTLNDRRITFSWANDDSSHKYCYAVHLGPAVNDLYMWYPSIGSGKTYEKSLTMELPQNYNGILYWWVRYGIQTKTGCEINLSTTLQNFILNADASATTKNDKSAITTFKNTNNDSSESMIWNVDTTKSDSEVLGIQDNSIYCKYKYLKDTNTAKPGDCKTPMPMVTNTEASFDGEHIAISGTYNSKLPIKVDIYQCKHELLDPRTWFTCKEALVKTEYVNTQINIFMQVKGEKNIYPIDYFIQDEEAFKATSQVDNKEKKLKLEYKYKILVPQYNIHIESNGDIELDIKKSINNQLKPFLFPLSKIVDVAQWHGNTSFQKPHTGIDFSTLKQDVLAVADGEIVSKGWDNSNGDCFSGGNYILVKQINGMYVVYFHLSEIFVDVGQKVKPKEVIASSGNTGSWNCQPLAYHLHFETRLGRLQSSHVNPVEYINTDWNKILTANARNNPDRLSGDNPHPGI